MSKEKAARLGDTASGHGCFPPTTITSGSDNVFINGKPAARVGDSLGAHGCSDCPPHGRAIAQGSSKVFINGRPAARTGDAIDCGGVVISGSGNVFIGGDVVDYAVSSDGSYEKVGNRLVPAESNPMQNYSTNGAPSALGVNEQEKVKGFEVGYIINKNTTTLNELYDIHVSDQTNFKLESMFRRHNDHLKQQVLAGEIVIFANEPKTATDEENLKTLQEQARIASEGVQQLTEEEAKLAYETLPFLDHVAEHQDNIGVSTAGLGVLSAATGARLDGLKSVLQEMNRNYLTNVENVTGVPKFTSEFYRNQQVLRNKLNNAVERLTMSKLSIGDAPKIKHTLGLSNKSILHNWDTVKSNGSVPELGKHINRVAAIARGAKAVGFIGIGIDAGISASNITHACVGEDTSQCERVSYKETVGLTGAVIGAAGGGSIGAKVGAAVGGGIVLLLGIASGGVVIAIATVVGAGTGAYVGSSEGKEFGQDVGNIIYEYKTDIE